jgi:hypothetical protein
MYKVIHKEIGLSSLRYPIFINADDRYISDVTRSIAVPALERSLDVIYGDLVCNDGVR